MTTQLLLFPLLMLYLAGTVTSSPGLSLYLLCVGEPLEAPLSSPDLLYPFSPINTIYKSVYQLLPKADGSPGSLVVMVNQDNILRTYSLETGAFQQYNITFAPGSGSLDVLTANPVSQTVILYISQLFSSPLKNLTIINPFDGTVKLMPLFSLNIDVVAMDLDVSRQILYVLRGDADLPYPPLILESYNLQSGKLLGNATFDDTDLLGADQFLKVIVNQQSGELWGILGSNLNSTQIVSINPSTFALQIRANFTFYSLQWFFDDIGNQFYTVVTGGVWIVPISTFSPQQIRLIPSDSGDCYKGTWTLGASSPLHQTKTTKSLAPTSPILYSVFNTPINDAWISLDFAVQLISMPFLTPDPEKTISPLVPVNGYATTGIMSCHQATDDYFLQSPKTLEGQFLNLIYFDNNTISKQVVLSTSILLSYDRSFALNSKTNQIIVSIYDPDPLITPPPDYNYAFFTVDIMTTNPSPNQVFSFKTEFADMGYPVWVLDEPSQTILVLQTSTSLISAIQWPSGQINWMMAFPSFSFWNNDYAGIALDSDNKKMYILTCPLGDDCLFYSGPMNIVEFIYDPVNGAKNISTTALGSLDPDYIWFSKTLSSVIVLSDFEWVIYNTGTKEVTRGYVTNSECSDCSVLRYL